MELLFATGNQRKLLEANAAGKKHGLTFKPIEIDIHEIQHHDPLEVTKQKARSAWGQIGKPVVVNDTSWNIPALNGFPGAYMKDVAEWFNPEDFLALIKNKRDMRVCCIETTVYKDGNTEKLFTKQFWGKFAIEPKGSGNSIEQVAIFNGKTLGEYRDRNELAFDSDDYAWKDVVDWYINYTSE